MLEKAYELTEKCRDCQTLVELYSEEILCIKATQKDLSKTTSNRKAVERENVELAHSKKQTMKRMEAYFDKFREVHAVEMYEYLV